MLVSSTRGGWKEGATLVAQQLEAIGVHFTVAPVDEATWNGAVANDNFEAVYNGGASSPQITMASWFGTGFSATHSGFVKAGGHDEVLPPLITQMAQETDAAKRKEIYTQIQTVGTDLDADGLARQPDRPRRHPPAGRRPQRRERDARVHDPADGRRGRPPARARASNPSHGTSAERSDHPLMTAATSDVSGCHSAARRVLPSCASSAGRSSSRSP